MYRKFPRTLSVKIKRIIAHLINDSQIKISRKKLISRLDRIDGQRVWAFVYVYLVHFYILLILIGGIRMAKMIIIYNEPINKEGFEAHYFNVHIPLAQKMPFLEKAPVITIVE